MNLQQLTDHPQRFDFYQAVYLLQRQLGGSQAERALGQDNLPGNEVIRFKVPPHLGFPGPDIEKVTPVDRLPDDSTDEAGPLRVDMHVTFMGLTGPSGVLPRHYSELMLQRLKHKDSAMQAFFDLFNHRLISLFYRTWEKHRFPIQYQRRLAGEPDPVSRILAGLTGSEQDLELFFGGLFARQIRNRQGLRQIVQSLSGCQVHVSEFVGRWCPLNEDEQTRLGSRQAPEGQHARLGCSTTLGQQVWDVASAIDVELRIQSPDQARALMPGGQLLALIQRVVNRYLPVSMKVRWRLRARLDHLSIASLSRHGPGLGQGGVLMMRNQCLDRESTITIA